MTEYMKTPAYVQYMVWPRATALAEVGWTSKEGKNFEDFSKRLETHKKRLDFLVSTYFGAPSMASSNTSGRIKSSCVTCTICKGIPRWRGAFFVIFVDRQRSIMERKKIKVFGSFEELTKTNWI